MNWFNTLNDSLNSENLLELLEDGAVLLYSQVLRCVKNGTFFVITRDNRGMYERPVHYKTQCPDFISIYNY